MSVMTLSWKLRQTIDNGVRDQIENYNMHHSIFDQQHPKALQPFLTEIRAFTEHNHYNILHPILQSVPIVLNILDVRIIWDLELVFSRSAWNCRKTRS